VRIMGYGNLRKLSLELPGGKLSEHDIVLQVKRVQSNLPRES